MNRQQFLAFAKAIGAYVVPGSQSLIAVAEAVVALQPPAVTGGALTVDDVSAVLASARAKAAGVQDLIQSEKDRINEQAG